MRSDTGWIGIGNPHVDLDVVVQWIGERNQFDFPQESRSRIPRQIVAGYPTRNMGISSPQGAGIWLLCYTQDFNLAMRELGALRG